MSREFSVFIVCLYLLNVHLSHSIFTLFLTDLSHHLVNWQTAHSYRLNDYRYIYKKKVMCLRSQITSPDHHEPSQEM